MKLYEITDKYSSALSELSEIDDLPAEVVADTMEAIEGEFQEKVQAVAAFIGNSDGDINTLKAHAESISSRIKKLQRKNESLKEYLRFNMEKTGITKVECPFFSVSLRKGSTSVLIDDESLIPPEYIKTTTSPIKTEIAKALKSGRGVSGASLKTGNPSVIIKLT